jgi:catechol 2,3-dioxygenase-like lactoylglutathione lyase family enzyme
MIVIDGMFTRKGRSESRRPTPHAVLGGRMPITRLNHVMITIPRGAEAQARAFYCDLLGLPEIAKPDALAGRGGLWDHRRATKAHLAYEVTDLDVWRKKLQEYAIVESIPLPNYERFEARDPFGNRIELIQPIPVNTMLPTI